MLNPKYQTIRSNSKRSVQPFEINPYDLSVEIEHILGKDGNAIIYRGLLKSEEKADQKSSFIPVSIKILLPPITLKSRIIATNEIRALKALKHNSHITSMIGYINTSNDLMIVSNFCHLGHLSELVQSHPCHYLNKKLCPTVFCVTSEQLISIFWQIADGLSFVTLNGIVHRDIVAENVFITDNMVAKLGGFKRCMIKQRIGDSDEELPLYNQAVETLLEGVYSEKSDVWQFGNLMFEVFSGGALPFGNLTKSQMIQIFTENETPQPVKPCPNVVSDLTCQCWKMNPDDRPSFSQLKYMIASTFVKSRPLKCLRSYR